MNTQLELHYHPLASFCHKVLVGLYENEVAFVPRLVDLGDATSRAAFEAIWPMAKMPVLVAGDEIVPESTIILEWLDLHRPGPVTFVPREHAIATRLADRFYDSYVQDPMQRIVADRLRPKDQRDALGVAQARAMLAKSYAHVEAQTASRTWAVGDVFTMADCAAAPALYWANRVQPITTPNAKAYLARLVARPSYRRVLAEAEPYQRFFPAE